MPSVASILEKKEVMQWHVCIVQGRDTLKITISQMHDNVLCVYFIHIAPNHQCANFVNSWRILTLKISVAVIHYTKT